MSWRSGPALYLSGESLVRLRMIILGRPQAVVVRGRAWISLLEAKQDGGTT